MGRTSLAFAPSNPLIVYALSASIAPGDFEQGLHAVFQSTDGGATWSARVRNTDPTKLNTVLLSNPVEAFKHDCWPGTYPANSWSNRGWSAI